MGMLVPLRLSPWLRTLRPNSLGSSLLSLLGGPRRSLDAGIPMIERLGSQGGPPEHTSPKTVIVGAPCAFCFAI